MRTPEWLVPMPTLQQVRLHGQRLATAAAPASTDYSGIPTSVTFAVGEGEAARGTTLVMGAFGGRGLLLAAADTRGFQLATRTDAMLTRTSSEAVAACKRRKRMRTARGWSWKAPGKSRGRKAGA